MDRTVSQDLLARFGEQLKKNPYPVYHVLRKLDPVHWSPSWGAWFLTRFEDIWAIKKDNRFSVGRVSDFTARFQGLGADLDPLEARLGSWLLFMDPPRHTRMRALIGRAFTPRSLRRMEGIVAERVDLLLDAVDPSAPVDLMSALASPLPVMTIADILGARREDLARVEGWSHHLVSFLGSSVPTANILENARESLGAMEEYFRWIVGQRREQPGDDLTSELLAARLDDGEQLSEDEILAVCTLLFAAGHDTTTNLIGNGCLALLQHPAERKKLVDDMERIEAAVEEILRFDGPSQITSRYLTEDVEVGGKTLARGDCVNLCIGAANRDPVQFAEPDRFDLDRPPGRTLAFGIGIHFCLGSFLARMEARSAFLGVLRRWPSLRLAAAPEHYESVGFRRLKRLEVELLP